MNKTRLKPIAAALATAGIIGASIAGVRYGAPELLSPAHAATAPAAVAAPMASVALPDFSAIAARVGPAVVNITVTQDVKATSVPRMQGMEPGDPFFEFFRRFGGAPMPRGPVQGAGSGFIVSPDGYILTNAHVVDNASEVIVKLTDRREFKAKVIGADARTDVALIKIDAKDLPAVALGQASDVRVGEWVVAIGSPFGFESSVTAGIVSAKSRALPNESAVPFIQTDVAINPGNSGGPLLNLKGEVVGINSQIYSRSGGYMGLSFAIPIETAIKVKDDLAKYGKVSHGRLGVSVQEVNQPLAESFGLDRPRGALVSSVEPGSAADKAGIRTGDIILSVDGEPIQAVPDLPARISALRPGTQAKLEVWREKSSRTIEATIGEADGGKVASAGPAAAGEGRLGVTVRPLQAEERKEARVDSGLVVEDVAGAAERAGIRPGDVILSANGNPVKTTAELRELVAKAGKNVALLVQRDGARIFVPINLG